MIQQSMRHVSRAGILFFAVVPATTLAACRRTSPPAPPAAVSDAGAAPRPLALPDSLAGFAGDPIVHGPTETWIRRRYQRGAVHVDVTLAIAQQPPGGFESWLSLCCGGFFLVF